MYILLSLFTTQALLQEIVTSKLPTRLHIYTFVFINNTILINFRFKRVKIYPKKKNIKKIRRRKNTPRLEIKISGKLKTISDILHDIKNARITKFLAICIFTHRVSWNLTQWKKKKDWRIDTLTDWRLKHCLSRNLLRFGIHTWILMEFIH